MSKAKLEGSLKSLIWKQFKDFYIYYLCALFFLFLTLYVQSLLPFWAKEIADTISSGVQIEDTSKFYYLAIAILIFRTLSRLLFFYPARLMERDLRVDLVKKIENTSPWRYLKFDKGQLFQIIYTDIEHVRALVGFALLQVGNVIFAIVILVPQIASFNAKLLWALLPMLIAFLVFTFIIIKTLDYRKKTMDLQGDVQNIIMETYKGKQTIKNFHVEKSFINWFKEVSSVELLNFYKAGSAGGIATPLLPLGIGFSLLLGAHIIYLQDLGASSLVLFSGFVFLFMEPLMYVAWVGIVWIGAIVSWGRISDLINSLNQKSKEEITLDRLNKSGNNEELNVCFWDIDILININKHSWPVIIGATGCGKTTVMQQVAEVLKNKNQTISFVSQTPYIYNDTLENNIFLGLEEKKRDKSLAIDLLILMGLDILTKEIEELLSLEVGENGKRLSGGQAKRVCLIRSIISGANYLLWDDPFSSVDLILEKEIIKRLKSLDLMQNKTVVLTSHRLSTVRFSDNVIFLKKDEGIIEEGSVKQLLKKETKTYEHFKKQMV